jgi:2-polyprenyl-3-methyl-5-hydroxy-6-metoxy-1,4-benzoquinol methylase
VLHGKYGSNLQGGVILVMVDEAVRRFYSGFVSNEWNRFESPYRRLEYDTTIHYLERYLPEKGLILDAGGGPGRYTVALAMKGYDVILLEPVAENLEFAKNRIKHAKVQSKVKEVREGSIEDLSAYEDGTFDAVLCLGGPLSHVVDPKREKRQLASCCVSQETTA